MNDIHRDRERKRERQGERKRGREIERQRKTVPNKTRCIGRVKRCSQLDSHERHMQREKEREREQERER